MPHRFAWFGLSERNNNTRGRFRLEAGETRVLRLAFPESRQGEIEATLRLIHTFATVGSRSRGGWGSLHLDGYSVLQAPDLALYAEELDRCLDRDWPARIVRDERGVWVWRSREVFLSWDQAIRRSALWRAEIRSALRSERGDLREVLGFAKQRKRMASPALWRVFREGQRLRLQVAIFAHAVPQSVGASWTKPQLAAAWRTVARMIDQLGELERVA